MGKPFSYVSDILDVYFIILAKYLVLTFSMFNITEKSYNHFSRCPENGRFAPGVEQNARPCALCINRPH